MALSKLFLTEIKTVYKNSACDRNIVKLSDSDDFENTAIAHLMTYDAWNRLVKITDNAGSPATIATYEYDGLGRRIEKTVGGDTWDYYHSSSWQVLEVRKNGDTDPEEQFVYDGTYIDAPFMRYHDANQDGDYADTDEGEHYFFRDASYNIVAYAGDDGTIKERYRYTPYGERIAMTSAFVDKAGSDYGQQRGFQGLRHDDESGLIENRNRMLDPGTGRFLQRDPLGYPNGMNAYVAYHVLWGGVDPYGMKTETHTTGNWYISWSFRFQFSETQSPVLLNSWQSVALQPGAGNSGAFVWHTMSGGRVVDVRVTNRCSDGNVVEYEVDVEADITQHRGVKIAGFGASGTSTVTIAETFVLDTGYPCIRATMPGRSVPPEEDGGESGGSGISENEGATTEDSTEEGQCPPGFKPYIVQDGDCCWDLWRSRTRKDITWEQAVAECARAQSGNSDDLSPGETICIPE